ncbi:MAG: type II secretion system protein [bacterium]|nr:type II secretion system protein [bacterium]
MKAFPLIELIVVVAILGILSSIAVPQFNKALVRANVARAQGDMAALHHALMAFANDHHDMFPLIRQDFYKGASGGEAKTRLERLAPLTSPVAYISAIPRDPFVKGGVESDPRTMPPHDVFIYWDEETTKKYRDANAFFEVSALKDAFGLYKQKKNQEGFVLISHGPDQIFEIKDESLPANALSPQARPNAQVALSPGYDPSNGLGSPGNLYFPGIAGKER